MRDMTIEEFCDKHDASDAGREWALANCTTMREAWDSIQPEWLIWIATRQGVLTDRELRLFAVHCAESVKHLMTDERSLAAIEVAKRHANGEATDAELAASREASWEATREAAGSATWAATGSAAWAATWAAAREASWADFAAWLRANTHPSFCIEGAELKVVK